MTAAPKTLYHSTCTPPHQWPMLTHSVDTEVCVVGGGFTGVNAALELAQRGYRVTLLEARQIGWGASGRNGGELIRGVGHALEQFHNQIGQEGVLALQQMGVEALELVKARINSLNIECELQLGYADLATCTAHIRALEAELSQLDALGYPHPVELLQGEAVRAQVVNSERYPAALVDHGSAHLHPLKLLYGEALAAHSAGVSIYEHTPVIALHKGERPRVCTPQGEVVCDRLILAGNAYLDPALEPWLGGKILPAGSYLIATEPLPANVCEQLMPGRKAVADLRTELDYFRIDAAGRLIFGGLCTYSGRDPRDIAAALRPNLQRVFPRLSEVNITHQWGGMLGIGANRLPQIGQLPDCPAIFYAQAYAGHGLNATHLAARLLAEAISGDEQRFRHFAAIHHLTFPGGRYLRSPLLAAGMFWYRLRDWWRER